MDMALLSKADKLQKAVQKKDTTAIWRILSSVAEKAFADHNGLEGKDRKAMTGRGNFNQVKQKIKAEGGKGLDDTIESVELHLRAEAYGTQGRRLQHTIDRLAKIANRQTHSDHRHTLKEQNASTRVTILATIINNNDAEEIKIIEIIANAPPEAAAVGAILERARK